MDFFFSAGFDCRWYCYTGEHSASDIYFSCVHSNQCGTVKSFSPHIVYDSIWSKTKMMCREKNCSDIRWGRDHKSNKTNWTCVHFSWSTSYYYYYYYILYYVVITLIICMIFIEVYWLSFSYNTVQQRSCATNGRYEHWKSLIYSKREMCSALQSRSWAPGLPTEISRRLHMTAVVQCNILMMMI